MKSLVIALMFLVVSLSASAKKLPTHRVVFEVPPTAGTIKKMQIDLTEENGKWTADTKSIGPDGKAQEAQLFCQKVSGDEFNCDRDDNGGGFNLRLAPAPKLTVNFFMADEEGGAGKANIKKSKYGPAVFEGKKATVSTKDAL
jgi:hypothetical protein